MKNTQSSHQLSASILLSLIIGGILGSLLKPFSHVVWVQEFLINGLFDLGGQVFIASLRMLVVPLVFFSLVCGVSNLDHIKRLSSLGLKTLFLYLMTTAIAISLALCIATILQPGQGFHLTPTTQFTAATAPSLKEVLLQIFPSNPIKAAADGNMLQVIVFALLFGAGLSLSRQKTTALLTICDQLNTVNMMIITLLMKIAPYGVFCLITKVFADLGFEALAPLLKYFFLVVTVLFLHLLLTYGFMLRCFTTIPISTFVTQFRSVMLFAFSTASSNASLPVTMKTVIDQLKVRKSTAAFTLPLGATINMDGTAIMQGVATVFISQAYQIDMTWSAYLLVVLTATLASIGTAGVPGVGLITLAMVLKQVGLPVEGIGLIIGVDRLLDMLRTAVNVCGDATVSCVVDRWESPKPNATTVVETAS